MFIPLIPAGTDSRRHRRIHEALNFAAGARPLPEVGGGVLPQKGAIGSRRSSLSAYEPPHSS